MQSITEQEETNRGPRTRNLTARRCSSPLSLIHLRHGDAGSSVRTFGYHELPKDQLLNLSILKLDGSLFDVHVTKKATVGDLKQTVEEMFSSLPKEGQGNVSWSHVWGHFCLCFEGQKLLSDKALIQTIGIKDGDQLQFIRHLSICNSPLQKQTKSEGTCKKSWRFTLGSNARQEKEQGDPTDGIFGDEEEAHKPEFKLAHFLKGWLSYSRFKQPHIATIVSPWQVAGMSLACISFAVHCVERDKLSLMPASFLRLFLVVHGEDMDFTNFHMPEQKLERLASKLKPYYDGRIKFGAWKSYTLQLELTVL